MICIYCTYIPKGMHAFFIYGYVLYIRIDHICMLVMYSTINTNNIRGLLLFTQTIGIQKEIPEHIY